MNTGKYEHHEMVVTQTFDDGSQEWHCPTCGRRFIMQWPPDYSKIVLEVGDEQAIHTGGSVDTSISLEEIDDDLAERLMAKLREDSLEASYEAKEFTDEVFDDPYLVPFLEYLEKRQNQ